MGNSHGRGVPFTPLRRTTGEFLAAGRRVPLVAIEREMPLADVIAARAASADRPSWFAIFTKAYAAVCAGRPDLRTAYLARPWPWGKLFCHAEAVANVIIARRVGDEDGVLGLRVRRPDLLSLADLDARLRTARTAPAETVKEFRQQLLTARLPAPLRRLAWWAGLNATGRQRARHLGTFMVTGVSALGSESLSLISPLTTTLTYGVFRPDGRVTVRLFYDHRVLDGVGPALALKELEETLRGPIVAELAGGVRRAA